MKTMKKIITLVMALALILSLSTAAFAAEGPPEYSDGTIEETEGYIVIENVVSGVTYSAYQVFKLESYDTDKEIFSYTVSEAWKDFVTTGAGKNYVKIENGYVTWIAATDDDTVAAFAAAALAYAKENNITPTKSHTVNSTTAFTFGPLELGYYLVDSTLGALCNLTTTDNHAWIYEKNPNHTIDKDVKDADGEWVDENTASVGDTVEFKITLDIKGPDDQLVVHDLMDDGLTFGEITSVTLNGNELVPMSADVTGDYSTTFSGCAEGVHTFHVQFYGQFPQTLKDGDVIEIYYNAILNENAVITGIEKNKSTLEYGDKYTLESETTTKTFNFDLVKTDVDDIVLEGAQFKLYSDEALTDEIGLVQETVEGETYYRVAKADETNTVAYIEAGVVTVKGLANGTYYLSETQAPANGYNRIKTPIEVTINGADLDAVIELVDDVTTYVSGGVQVINKTGLELPSFGGMGTTLFYVLGGILVLAAVVLLVTKKRMNAQA